jgi:hypothetical protein
MDVDRQLAAAVCGESVTLTAALRDAARRHGLDVLLQYVQEGVVPRHVLAIDIVRDRELDALIDSFEHARIELLLMKGAALSRTLYPLRALRPRCDSDVFIRERDLDAARALLRAHGYEHVPHGVGDLVIRQQLWRRVDSVGITHDVDLHWAMSNRPRHARAFAFEPLFARAQPLPERTFVRALSPEDALLHAAAHLTGHHEGEERLIWLYDIHLLASHLGLARLDVTRELARERSIERELVTSLAAAHRLFGTALPREMAIDASGLNRSRPLWRRYGSDFLWTRGVRARARFVAQHLVPSRAHVSKKYETKQPLLLPFYYMRRAASAAARVVLGRW